MHQAYFSAPKETQGEAHPTDTCTNRSSKGAQPHCCQKKKDSPSSGLVHFLSAKFLVAPGLFLSLTSYTTLALSFLLLYIQCHAHGPCWHCRCFWPFACIPHKLGPWVRYPSGATRASHAQLFTLNDLLSTATPSATTATSTSSRITPGPGTSFITRGDSQTALCGQTMQVH